MINDVPNEPVIAFRKVSGASSSSLVKAVEVMSKCSAWRSASQSLGNAISEEQLHGWIMMGTEALKMKIIYIGFFPLKMMIFHTYVIVMLNYLRVKQQT